jgi:cellulose synthase/poly-beta-1,6-N-acetylglucosamine synthase-like glycosyltransferase
VLPTVVQNATFLLRTLLRHTKMQQAVLIICLLLIISYTAIIIYYAIAWLSLPNWQLATTQPIPKGLANSPITAQLSIIIPARNEEDNIGACIQSILNQSYSKNLYEIIVVNDHSTDATASIVKTFNEPNIKCIDLINFIGNETNSFKKKGIEVGVAQANGELIITTDADCVAPPNWLQTIAAFYEEKKPDLIVMPVSIFPSPSGEGLGVRFIEIFQALDFMTLQGITGSAVHKKIHSMCNGANLAYTKKAFNTVNGFAGINNIASGDDMMLMHKIYSENKKGIVYLKSAAVIVQTKPVKTITEFINQRIRWASKADKYEDKRMLPVLIVVYFFNMLLLILPIVAILSNFKFLIFNFQFSTLQFWFWLLLFKMVIEIIFLIPIAKFFNKLPLLFLFPLMQPFHIIYTVIAGWLGKFGRYSWKGRQVK